MSTALAEGSDDVSTLQDRVGENRAALYKKREKIFPKRVHGPFRSLKWLVMAVTLAIYYATPWLRWDRGAYAPDQAVLVDLAHRRFYFFGVEIWPQEFYYVAGLLIMAGIGLFLLTSTVGRAWCGYACPQTVWTDLFMAVERRIEGDRNARMKLDKAPWTLGKIARRFAVHSSWLVIGLLTGGAWVFYFADAPTLARELASGQAASTAYASVAILTATTYVFGGLMREQVCIYMCPWPRIQSAMLDENSLVVTYKGWRGEPRGHGTKRLADVSDLRLGDCVDCAACVNVCPTGIDIRNGPQLACITCALCIDACNDVMARLGRPQQLIGYTTLARDRAEASGRPLAPLWRTIVRPRTLLYLSAWSAIGLAMLVVLAGRDRLDLTVSHDRNPMFVQMSNGDIRNGYTVKLLNMEPRPRRFELSLDGLPGGLMWDALEDGEATRRMVVDVRPDGLEALHLYVRAPRRTDDADFRFVARELGGVEASTEGARFTVPGE
jgi:cytochrome c oxidase accessory protein FixG